MDPERDWNHAVRTMQLPRYEATHLTPPSFMLNFRATFAKYWSWPEKMKIRHRKWRTRFCRTLVLPNLCSLGTNSSNVQSSIAQCLDTIINGLVAARQDHETDGRLSRKRSERLLDGGDSPAPDSIVPILRRESSTDSRRPRLVDIHTTAPAHVDEPVHQCVDRGVLWTLKIVSPTVKDDEDTPMLKRSALVEPDVTHVPTGSQGIHIRRVVPCISHTGREELSGWDDGHLVADADIESVKGRGSGKAQLPETLAGNGSCVDIGWFGGHADHVGCLLIEELASECLVGKDLADFRGKKVAFYATHIDQRHVGVLNGDIIF